MNKFTYYFLLCSVFGFSQNITFSDPDLLTYLTTKKCVDTNGDGIFNSTADFNNDNQIQLSEALQVTHFSFSTLAHNIQSISGFENFSNLQHLNVSTISINHLDFSVWPSLQYLKLSSNIDSFNFNNPMLTFFWLQNTGFNDPLFDLTNCPNLEIVKIQSGHLNDNVIFGTHNNMEQLYIDGDSFSSLNFLGMPNIKNLVIGSFIGSTIDISNCTVLRELKIYSSENLDSIIGIGASPMLEHVLISKNIVEGMPSTLDVSFNNQPIKSVNIMGVNSISISNAPDLSDVELSYITTSINFENCIFNYIDSHNDARLAIHGITSNQISFSNVTELEFLTFSGLNMTIPLDLSEILTKVIYFVGCNIPEINLKNGDILEISVISDSNINFICVDNDELSIVENSFFGAEYSTVINPYCSFVLGGDYYEVTGDILIDLGTGCENNISPVFDLQFSVTDGTSTDTFYANSTNNYSYTLPEGSHTLSTQITDLDYWTVNPSNIILNFPADASPFPQDFCIMPNGIHNDLEVIIIPLEGARPGFEADYKIIYKNKGNTTLSGSVNFTFDDNYMNFLDSNPIVDSQATSTLIWNYSNLQPFETREIGFTMLLNTPTNSNFPLSDGDLLHYTATINPSASDETMYDNVTSLNQQVVNSFDPNDMTCIEGNTITLEHVGQYVHYVVRFENTGSANAVNVVVKNVIDSTKYDLLSLVPLNASHDFYTRIRNGNEVEFIFENIQLPFDDANNDGYVLFKIKTLPSLNVGESFSNQANIYFDYNAPIVTNNETTTIQNNLKVSDFSLSNVRVYPNPTSNHFNIKNIGSLDIKTIDLHDISGKKLKEFSISEEYEIDDLASGVYFIKIKTEKSEITKKIIKL